jgi:hypothetical protein
MKHLPLVGIFVLLLALLACGSTPTATPQQQAPPTATIAPKPTDTAKPAAPTNTPKPTATPIWRLTLAMYNLLTDGISYADAVKIIGKDGTEMSRSSLGGYVTVMYSWQNSDGSNMNAMFQNDKLIQKAQFGLK